MTKTTLTKSKEGIQLHVNIAAQEFRKEFKEAQLKSGKTELMFKLSHEGIQRAAEYELVRIDVVEQGFEMPVFDEKATIKFFDDKADKR